MQLYLPTMNMAEANPTRRRRNADDMLILLAQNLKDSVPEAVAQQVPGLYVGLAAISAVVAAFLLYLVIERKASTSERKDTREFIKELGESCHTHNVIEGQQNRATINRATACIEQNTKVLGSVAELMRRVHGEQHDDPDFSSGWLNRTDEPYTYRTRDGDDLTIEPGNAIIPTPDGWRVITMPQWREWKSKGKVS